MRRRAMAAIAVLALVATGCSQSDVLDPAPGPGEDGSGSGDLSHVAPPMPLEQLPLFSGVATMNAGSNCTGTLIDTQVPEGPAYILTNGHCVGDVGRSRQQTTVDLEWFGTAEFFRADGNLDNTLMVDVLALEYSTMHWTDTAIVLLDATLGELEAQGVRAVPIADAEPKAGDDVTNIGVPVINVMDDDVVMRRGDCTLGEQHTLIEFGWIWRDAWANDCPGIVGGSSGSPLLRLDATGAPAEVVAMINTTSHDVDPEAGGWCAINRPCRVTADEVVLVADSAYAQSVAGVGQCFDAKSGIFGLNEECPLPFTDMWTLEGGGAFQGGGIPDSVGRTPTVALTGAKAGTARVALVPLGNGEVCLDPATYSQATELAIREPVELWEWMGEPDAVDLNGDEGWYALCAVRGDNYSQAITVLFEIDRTPPVIPAGAEALREPDGLVLVQPHLNPPELSNIRFIWGPQGEVDCVDTASFQEFWVVPLFLLPEDLPATYCVYGMDDAGNSTPVTQVEIPRD